MERASEYEKIKKAKTTDKQDIEELFGNDTKEAKREMPKKNEKSTFQKFKEGMSKRAKQIASGAVKLLGGK